MGINDKRYLMSGITCIFRRDGKGVDPADIKKMNDEIAHRGPDGSRVWCEGPVAFGHQMLHTTPESLHEILPSEDKESGLVITADARIDNREELAAMLGIEDMEYVSDSYFILKAYQEWGEKCPDNLLGDFAFAIWDKNNKTLFCARDHMGVKPFYYYLSDKIFYFATEPKALLHSVENINKLNKNKIAEHLVGIFLDREKTFYENIIRLPAAHILKLDLYKVKKNKYWEFYRDKEIQLDSDEDYVKSFLEIFRTAVQCRSRTAFPIGSLLSGGLDSSSIVCNAEKIIRENGDPPLKTFSAIFEEVPECDEQFYIKKILKGCDLEPYFINVDQISLFSDVDDILWHLDEPLNGHNHYIIWHLFRYAQKKNIRVIFDGHGGDNTIIYNERFLMDHFFSLHWRKGIVELIKRSENIQVNFFMIFFRSFLLPITPIFFVKVLSLFPFNIGMIEKFDLLSKSLIQETNIIKRYYQQKLRPYKAARKTNDFHRYIINSGNLQYFLELKDKLAAANTMEARYPFYDKRLIEFCLALPHNQINASGWDRIIMRHAMKDILPSEVQWRKKKSSFDPNFRRRIMLEKQDIYNILFKEGLLNNKCFNINSIHKLYNDYITKGKNIVRLWRVLSLVFWLHHILKKPHKSYSTKI